MPLTPLEVKVDVTGIAEVTSLIKAFQRFADEVDGVEQFLRLKPMKERLECADQLRLARLEFEALLDELEPESRFTRPAA